MRRTLLLAALLVLGTMVSGAMARDGGSWITEVEIDFPPVDTTAVLEANGLATSQINDSIFFASSPFFYDGPWTNLVCYFVVATKDTATATGLCRDSVLIALQTRIEDDSVTFWRTVGVTTKYPLAAWDSTGTAAARATQLGSDGDGVGFITEAAISAAGYGSPYRGIPSSRINLSDADSVASVGTYFRFLTLYSAEEDSLKSHVTWKSNTTIDILSKLKAIVQFHLR